MNKLNKQFFKILFVTILMNNSLFNVPFTENYFHLNELLAATSKGSSLKTSDTVEEKNNKATSSSTSKSEYNKNSSSNDNDNSTRNNSSNTTSSQSVNSNIKTYDPFLDNHLRTPARGENHGKFGLPIKDIENDLYKFIDVKNIVNAKTSYGGTAKKSILKQISELKKIIKVK